MVDVPSDFEQFPRQAWKFTLTGVKPIAQTWISRAVNYFKDRVLGQKHDVQLLHMDGSTVVVDILIRDGESQTSLSSLLVSEGFALLLSLSQCLVLSSDRPDIEQELFAEGVDCSAVTSYSGCNDLDLIAGVPRSPCDTIGDIHSQIQFMRDNTEKLAQSKEARGPMRQEESKDSEDASAPKVKPGKPRGLERADGGKKLTYIYPPRRRDRPRGLGKDFETLATDKGSDGDPAPPNPLPQGKHHSPGLPRQTNHNSPDTLSQGNHPSPTPNKPANHHNPPDPKSQGNHHVSSDSIRQGGRDASPSPRRQGSHPQTRVGNCGGGDRIQKKPLPKSKSPVRSGSSKDRKMPGDRAGSVLTREQLQNEYDWHSSQVTFKVDKILEDITEETLTTTSRELHKLLSTVSPTLLELPGDGALYLSLEAIVRSAITDKMPCDLAVKLVESLSDILRKILLKFNGSVVKCQPSVPLSVPAVSPPVNASHQSPCQCQLSVPLSVTAVSPPVSASRQSPCQCQPSVPLSVPYVSAPVSAIRQSPCQCQPSVPLSMPAISPPVSAIHQSPCQCQPVPVSAPSPGANPVSASRQSPCQCQPSVPLSVPAVCPPSVPAVSPLSVPAVSPPVSAIRQSHCQCHPLVPLSVPAISPPATHSDIRGTSELFSECLTEFINVAGTALESCFPNDHKTLFRCITDKLLSNDVARSVKENMLHLLIHHQTTAVAQRVDANNITMETVPVVMATKASQTEVTARVKTVDSEVQVELLPYNVPAPNQLTSRRSSCGSEADKSSVKSSDLDPYCRVKAMLSNLRLDELTDVFLSNAVRDSVLDVDFADLKDLLKECGVRPGELLEIKTYLAKKGESQATEPRTHSVYCWCNHRGHCSMSRSTNPEQFKMRHQKLCLIRPV
ncbi:hypothetical protein NP493_877g00019 [Ridgeia piscesae]|uniref:Uncharacterized protein n=1 Tax=Ridgeia piscesae TaxID=27915 RepID=A0AAD9KLJ7_RIDPI|nr:hypothetical protein NP493_877g00019 [Ridgeia piscesae]